MNDSKTKLKGILLIGIGNTGRNDDGLGWQFADIAAETIAAEMDIEYRYQLQVEDAELVSQYKTVFFADASVTKLPQGFEIKQCHPAAHYMYSSHAQTPETVLYLAKELYHHVPVAYTIAVEGNNWDMGTSLSKKAAKNLEEAMKMFTEKLKRLMGNFSGFEG